MDSYTWSAMCEGCKRYHERKGNCHLEGMRTICVTNNIATCDERTERNCCEDPNLSDAKCDAIKGNIKICLNCLTVHAKGGQS